MDLCGLQFVKPSEFVLVKSKTRCAQSVVPQSIRNQTSTIPRIRKITCMINDQDIDENLMIIKEKDERDDDHQADSLLDDKGAPLLRKLLDLLPRDNRGVRAVHDSS